MDKYKTIAILFFSLLLSILQSISTMKRNNKKNDLSNSYYLENPLSKQTKKRENSFAFPPRQFNENSPKRSKTFTMERSNLPKPKKKKKKKNSLSSCYKGNLDDLFVLDTPHVNTKTCNFCRKPTKHDEATITLSQHDHFRFFHSIHAHQNCYEIIKKTKVDLFKTISKFLSKSKENLEDLDFDNDLAELLVLNLFKRMCEKKTFTTLDFIKNKSKETQDLIAKRTISFFFEYYTDVANGTHKWKNTKNMFGKKI